MANPYDITNKYGIEHPLLKRLNKNKEEDPIEKLNSQIGNYQTRLSAMNQPIPEPKDNTNAFLKVLGWLDKPRNAVWNALEDSVKGENGFFEGLKQGWTGEEQYEGTDLMEDLGVTNKYAKGIGGFLAEAIADPLNLLTLGTGSFAKGALTGTAKTLGREGAEALTKATLKGISKEGAEQVAKNILKRTGKEVTEQAVEGTAKKLLRRDLNRVLSKSGIELGEDLLKRTPDDILKFASKELTDRIVSNEIKKAGPGLSVGIGNMRKTIASGDKMRQAGVATADFVKNKVPVVGNVVSSLQDGVNKIFNPSYIAGMSDAQQLAFKAIRDRTYGSKNLADQAVKDKGTAFAKTLSKYGDKSEELDKLIVKVIEGGSGEVGELNTDVVKIVNQMRADFKAMGMSEHEIGVLRELFEDSDKYFPHVYSWERQMELGAKAQAKGGITEKFKMYNPYSRARKLGNTVEQASQMMLYKTSSDEAKELFIDSIKRVVPDEKWQKYTKSGKGAEDFTALISSIPKDTLDVLYDGLDGIPDFFETSSVRAYITRGLSHNKIVADKEFLDGITAAFGTKMFNEQQIAMAIDEGKDVIIPKSSLSVFKIDTKETIGMNKAFKEATLAAKEEAAKQAAETTTKKAKKAKKVKKVNIELGEGVESTASKLSRDTAQLVKKIITDNTDAYARITADDYKTLTNLLGKQNIIEAYAMPKGVIEAVNNASRRQIDAGIQTIGKSIDKLFSIWKPTVTGLRPDYHVRNFAGGQLNNMLDVGMKIFDPKIQAHATALATKADGTVTLAGKELTYKQIRDAMTKTHANMNFQVSEFSDMISNMDMAVSRALSGGGAKGGVKNAVRHPLKSAANIGEFAGGKVEAQLRSANFLSNLENGLELGYTIDEAIQFAGEQVKKYHFDYTELTNAEKTIFRRIFPFYTWVRKNLPLQAEEFLNNPAFYTGFSKAQRNMAEAMGVDIANMPDWFKDEMAIPIGSENKEGRAPFLNISPPQKDLTMLDVTSGAPLNTIINMLAPYIKVPIETATNRSMLTGAPLYSNEHEKNQKLLMNALSQLGVFRDIQNTVSPKAEEGRAVTPLLDRSMLGATQSVLKDYSPTEGYEDAAYDYNRQLGNELQYLRDSGMEVPDVNLARAFEGMPAVVKELYIKYGIIHPLVKKKLNSNKKSSLPSSTKILNSMDATKKLNKFKSTISNMKNGGL